MFTGNLIEKLMEKDVVDSKKEGNDLVDVILETFTEALQEKDEVKVRGFGRFHTVDKEPRKARHPKTGEEIDVPARTYVRFKPSKMVKQMVNV